MEHVRCNLCGADDAVTRYPCTVKQGESGDWRAFRCTHSGYGRHHTIVQCQQCGLVYTDPRPDGQDIVETYQAVEDPLYIEEREGRVLTFEHHLKPLERLAGPPNGRSLLDVGCYIGIFVEIAACHGWDAWGVEPSRWAVEQAQARGLHVVQGMLETADLPEEYFDVVTMWDVIEHLPDPAGSLREIARILKPNGLLVVATPQLDSIDAKLFSRFWIGYELPRHLTMFSRDTLSKMTELAGFGLIVQRCLCGSFFAFYSSVRFWLRSFVPSGWPRDTLEALLFSAPMRLLQAPIFAVSDRLGMSSTITSFYRRHA